MSGMKQQGTKAAEGEVKLVQHLAFELTTSHVYLCLLDV